MSSRDNEKTGKMAFFQWNFHFSFWFFTIEISKDLNGNSKAKRAFFFQFSNYIFKNWDYYIREFKDGRRYEHGWFVYLVIIHNNKVNSSLHSGLSLKFWIVEKYSFFGCIFIAQQRNWLRSLSLCRTKILVLVL